MLCQDCGGVTVCMQTSELWLTSIIRCISTAAAHQHAHHLPLESRAVAVIHGEQMAAYLQASRWSVLVSSSCLEPIFVQRTAAEVTSIIQQRSLLV